MIPADSPPVRRAALVTGAASGIGAAVCRALAAPGMGIGVHTRRNRAGAEAVAAAARAAGAETLVLLGDLAEPETARLLVDALAARFGRLDVLVSNAGFADRTPLAELDETPARPAPSRPSRARSCVSHAPRVPGWRRRGRGDG